MRRTVRRNGGLLLAAALGAAALVGAPGTGSAQQHERHAERPEGHGAHDGHVMAHGPEEDVQAVLAVVQRLFDGMRANDGAMVRSTFAEGALLISTEDRTGAPAVRYIPVERFADAVDAATTPWDEPIWDTMVHVQEHLAMVWTKYAFYLGEELRHCGVDAFLLGRTPDGWKITALSDTRQTEGCETPPGR